MRFHFHKWVPKKAFLTRNGYECAVCGQRKVARDDTLLLESARQEWFDWINKKEPTQ